MHYALRNKEDWGSFQTLAAKMQGTKKKTRAYHRFFRIIDENNPGENNKETSKKR